MSELRSSAPDGGLRVAWRVPMLVLGMLSLLGGVAAGLLRLGWAVPLPRVELAAWHGPLMVAAFFGTVISLERAVALGRRWAYLAPAAAGAGGVALVAGLPMSLVGLLLSLSSFALCAATAVIHRTQRQVHTLVLLAATVCALLAAVAQWAGVAPPWLVGGWLGFLVLTIAGERLELSRFLPPSPVARRVFLVIVALLLPALPFFFVLPQAAGVLLVALALWLLRQDVARRTVRQNGLTRFIAVCLLSGYFWLAAGGALLLAGFTTHPFIYDAALHAIFVGFVLAMVFGHAPVIFPAVLRIRLPYHPSFYLPLLVLHGSLLLRVAGDLALLPEWRALGGAGNAAAIAAFVLTMLSAALRGRRPA